MAAMRVAFGDFVMHEGFILLFLSFHERTLGSWLALREEGQVELLGRRLTDLARLRYCQPTTDSVNAFCEANGNDWIKKNAARISHDDALLTGCSELFAARTYSVQAGAHLL